MIDKKSAERLAVALLRKSAAKTRFLSKPARSVETDSHWLFDFHHPQWRTLRRKNNTPFGMQIAVDKQTGKAEHYATLQKRNLLNETLS